MNKIPPKHYLHFEIEAKIRELQYQQNEFTLHTVHPFYAIGYLMTGEVHVHVELGNEIDQELFEAWLEDVGAPEDLKVIIDLVGSKKIPDAWMEFFDFDLDDDEYYDGDEYSYGDAVL